jgi:hypothetical protein
MATKKKVVKISKEELATGKLQIIIKRETTKTPGEIRSSASISYENLSLNDLDQCIKQLIRERIDMACIELVERSKKKKTVKKAVKKITKKK